MWQLWLDLHYPLKFILLLSEFPSKHWRHVQLLQLLSPNKDYLEPHDFSFGRISGDHFFSYLIDRNEFVAKNCFTCALRMQFTTQFACSADWLFVCNFIRPSELRRFICGRLNHKNKNIDKTNWKMCEKINIIVG